MTSHVSLTGRIILCSLVGLGAVLGLSGIDLVLPALPALPDQLDGTVAQAQFVLAAYVLGTMVGMLAFGFMASFVPRSRLLILAMVAFALLSWGGSRADSLYTLILLRGFQGFAASAPAVFAPAIIRALFSEMGAVRALGILGSVESLVPALAPIIGVWLLGMGGWTLSFLLTGVLATFLAIMMLMAFGRISVIQSQTSSSKNGSYARLLKSPVFIRYALSHALTLGGLLVYVFAMPVVITKTMGGTLDDFIIMQVVGISLFIVVTNLSGFAVQRFGAENVVFAGTFLAALGAVFLFLYGFFGGKDPSMLVWLFAPFNMGLGLRGPPGFLRAILAGGGDDDRASALVVVAITGVTSVGTAIAAPFVEMGLWQVSLISSISLVLAVLLLLLLPKLELPLK